MKKNMKNILIGVMTGILTFSSINIHAASSQNESAYLERYQSILQTMKTKMRDVSRTGDPALDYLYQMMPHHEAEMAMAQNILKYDINQKVKQMAQKTIKEQTDEVAKIQTLIKRVKMNPEVDKAQEAAYMVDYIQFYDAMISAMEDAKPTGNVDKDFLQQMMPHHDGAINISRSIFRSTSNQEVRQMAQNIVRKQTADSKEISKLMHEIK